MLLVPHDSAGGIGSLYGELSIVWRNPGIEGRSGLTRPEYPALSVESASVRKYTFIINTGFQDTDPELLTRRYTHSNNSDRSSFWFRLRYERGAATIMSNMVKY